MPHIEKGQSVPLSVTKESRHRVFAGLSWDPNENFGIIDEAKAMMGGKPVHHDLDLSAFVYGADKSLIECVTVESIHSVDKTGKIYHSGDNTEGLGKGDDEQVSVELKDLDEEIQHIVFVVTVKTGHAFGEVAVPEIRLGDGYTDRTLHETSLKVDAGKDKSCFVYARIYRDDDGWMIHNISEFLDTSEANEVSAIIKTYID